MINLQAILAEKIISSVEQSVNLPAVVSLNSSAVVLLIILILNSRSTIHHENLDNKLFFLMVIFSIFQAVIETVSFLITGVDFFWSYWLNVLVNAILFINNAIFLFVWVLYIDYKIFGDATRFKKRYVYVAIPAMIMIVASIINIFVPVFFIVDKITFVYNRTSYFPLSFITVVFYLTYGLILAYKNKNLNHKYIFFPILVFMIPLGLSVIADFLFYGINFLWMGTAISLASLYINLQNQVSNIDLLSGLFTRQYLTKYLQNQMRKHSSDKKLAGLMLDIDKFKEINDTYGHLVGDEAISAIGNILHNSIPINATAFRFGGDEFMVLQRVKDEQEILTTIDRINNAIKKFNNSRNANFYKLRLSIGYSICDGETNSLDDFLTKMDTAMYNEKKKRDNNSL